MDLVVSGTGVVGRGAAMALRRHGRPVRALVRGGAARQESAPLLEAGVECVDGDVTRPETLAAACRGVDTVICTVTSTPHGRDDGLRRVDHDGALALAEAAEDAGVRRYVYLSFTGAVTRDSPITRAKRANEDRLRRGRMSFVVLRPSFFMEVWLGPHLGFDPMRGTARVFGPGDRPVQFVSAADVAEFAAAAALLPGEPREIVEIGGPEAISPREVIVRCEHRLGRKLAVDSVPLAAIESQMQSSDPLEQSFAALILTYANGDPQPGAVAQAERFGVRLTPLASYLESLA